MPSAVAVVIATALSLQVSTPLTKSDLIRLLSSSLGRAEIADLVQRRCVSFTPSARDKEDLRVLGANDLVLRRLDECARKITPLQASARLREAIVTAGGRIGVMVELRRGDSPAPAVRVVLRGSGQLTGGPDIEQLTDAAGHAQFDIPTGRAAGTYRLAVADPEGTMFAGAAPLEVTVRPAPLQPAPARTGFASGTGQRGRVGTRLPLPLVFEARDSANRPVPAQAVAFTGHNAQVQPAQSVTDSLGRVAAQVTLGERAGPAYVVATLGGLKREAPLVALPGPPAGLSLRCGVSEIGDSLRLVAGADHDVAVRVQDASGNGLALTDLRVTASDPRTVRATVGTNGISLRAVRAGRSNVTVEAAGMRRAIATVVLAGDATGGAGVGAGAGCRRSVSGG